MIPPIDPSLVRYCERHEVHWFEWDGADGKGKICPWCQRDELQDKLDSLKPVKKQVTAPEPSKNKKVCPCCCYSDGMDYNEDGSWFCHRCGDSLEV